MNRHTELIRFVLDRAIAEPVAKRAKIYLGLADICGDPIEAEELRQLASELMDVEKHSRQFMFRFIQNSSEGHSKP